MHSAGDRHTIKMVSTKNWSFEPELKAFSSAHILHFPEETGRDYRGSRRIDRDRNCWGFGKDLVFSGLQIVLSRRCPRPKR